MPTTHRDPLCLPRRVTVGQDGVKAPPRTELPALHRSYRLMRQTKTLLTTSVVPISSGLCRLPRAPAGRWPFPTLSPRSVYRCLDPYPATIHRCICPFLPDGHRPLLRVKKIGSWNHPAKQLPAGEEFRGCSHSLMFRLPYLLGPLAVLTKACLGHRAVYAGQNLLR